MPITDRILHGPPPAFDCDCGIYVYKERELALRYALRERANILAEVLLPGAEVLRPRIRAIEYENGYRAEAFSFKRLCVILSRNDPDCLEVRLNIVCGAAKLPLSDAVSALSDYGVPVEIGIP